MKSMRDRRESIGRKLDRIEFRIKIFFAFYLSRQKQFQFILRGGGGRRKKNNLFVVVVVATAVVVVVAAAAASAAA